MKEAFNHQLFLGLQGFEGHYSQFSAGDFYKRHSDTSKKSDHRIISMIIYLNRNWQTGDGGELRVYQANTQTDIQPIGGTMVCFMSQNLEHEVLTNNKNRIALTGWFTTEAEY